MSTESFQWTRNEIGGMVTPKCHQFLPIFFSSGIFANKWYMTLVHLTIVSVAWHRVSECTISVRADCRLQRKLFEWKSGKLTHAITLKQNMQYLMTDMQFSSFAAYALPLPLPFPAILRGTRLTPVVLNRMIRYCLSFLAFWLCFSRQCLSTIPTNTL